MKLGHLDIGLAVIVLGFSMWTIAAAFGYGIFGPNVTGGGFFPLLTGSVMLVCSLGVIFDRTSRREFGDERLTSERLAPVAGIVLATGLLIALLPVAGLVPLTLVYVPAVAWCIERPRTPAGYLAILVLAVASAACCYLLFDRLLNIPLPWGIWED